VNTLAFALQLRKITDESLVGNVVLYIEFLLFDLPSIGSLAGLVGVASSVNTFVEVL